MDTTAKEGGGVSLGLWVQRKRWGMVFVGETSEYHSRGKEYIVLFRRPVGTTADCRGMVFFRGRHVSTSNRKFIESNTIVIIQKCIVLAKNNVMSVLAPI